MIATTIDSLTDVVEQIEKENERFKGSLELAVAALHVCLAESNDPKVRVRLLKALDDVQGHISDYF